MHTSIQKFQKYLYRSFLTLASIILVLSSCNNAQFRASEPKVEFISNINNQPLFSWKTESQNPGFQQSAVQLLIADNEKDIENNKGNIWDSGKVKTINSTQLKYAGDKLRNGRQYFAKLKLWDNKNRTCSWSEVIRFYTPIDYHEDWKAKWLTYDYQTEAALPVFKKVLNVENKQDIEWARLYIAAPGFYEAFLNGKKIGKNVLDPGQTNYEDYTYYSVYDLDLSDTSRKDVLGVMLGNGWYNQNQVWGKGLPYGQPVFICQLQIQYKNGEQKIIGTDESWMWKNGPITYSNIYGGESYDANKEMEDWFKPENDGDSWEKALLAKENPTNLFEQFADPIQKMESIQPKEITSNKDGAYIFDFGQNFAGWVKLKIAGEKGQQITLRCVEELDENGDIDPRTTGVRATKVIQTLKYTCKGDDIEIWEPQFTYFGFRYVEVEGLKEPPGNDLLEGIVVYSSLPKSGDFSCSEENINKLHELAEWTIKSNIHSIPTDCPHREKCGWTGDAHALIHTLCYNFDAQRFMSKYIFDMRSSARNTNRELYFGEHFHDRSFISKPKGIPTMIVPGKRTSGTASPDWGTAMTQIPWNMYLYYGDSIMLRNFYPDMKVWVDYIQEKNIDGIITHGLGDWCPPGGNSNIECPVPVSSTAYHILDLQLLAQSAKVLGKVADFAYYNKLHKKTVASFNRDFFDTENYTYGSQTADAMALDIGIVPEGLKEKVAESIVKNIHEKHNGFISTGIFGISRIFKVLADNGYEDEVYRLLTKKGENSFAFMWEHFDATTLWEVLPIRSFDEENLFYRSHSHPMQAGYDAWFYSGIAGINPSNEDPGFKKIVFKPYLTKYLNSANGSYESPYGKIVSDWKSGGNDFVWDIDIPANCSGEIYLPQKENIQNVIVDGNKIPISDLEMADGYTGFWALGKLESGKHHIEMH